MTGRRSHGRLSALNGVVHQGTKAARRYYDQQRGRGNDHHAALRSLAFKWMRILFRCWQDRTPYDEARYLDALRRHGSPLVKDVA